MLTFKGWAKCLILNNLMNAREPCHRVSDHLWLVSMKTKTIISRKHWTKNGIERWHVLRQWYLWWKTTTHAGIKLIKSGMSMAWQKINNSTMISPWNMCSRLQCKSSVWQGRPLPLQQTCSMKSSMTLMKTKMVNSQERKCSNISRRREKRSSNEKRNPLSCRQSYPLYPQGWTR